MIRRKIWPRAATLVLTAALAVLVGPGVGAADDTSSVAAVNAAVKGLIRAGQRADVKAMGQYVTPRIARQAAGFFGFPWMNVAAVCRAVRSLGPTTVTGDKATTRVRYDPQVWFQNTAKLIAARAKRITDPAQRAKALAFAKRFTAKKRTYRTLAELEFRLVRQGGQWLIDGLRRLKSGR